MKCLVVFLCLETDGLINRSNKSFSQSSKKKVLKFLKNRQYKILKKYKSFCCSKWGTIECEYIVLATGMWSGKLVKIWALVFHFILLNILYYYRGYKRFTKGLPVLKILMMLIFKRRCWKNACWNF